MEAQPALPTGTTRPTELYDLMRIVLTNTALSRDDMVLLLEELRKNNAGVNDRWANRWAVLGLSVAVILMMLSLPVLSWMHVTIPDGLVPIGSAAVGGLVGLLSSPVPARGEPRV